LLPVLSKAALAHCVGQDGGVKTDVFLNDPRDCRFDPAVVQCVAGQDPATCLSAAQVRAARQIYRGPHDPETGELIFPGYESGSEANAANWPAWIVGASRDADLSNDRTQGQALQEFFGNGFFADFVFQNPSFDFRTLNFTSNVEFMDQELGAILNSTDPDLTPFKAHGGKIIHYVGWADAAIGPINSVNYYNRSEPSWAASQITAAAKPLCAKSSSSIGCSWFPVWRIAAAAMVQMPSAMAPATGR
jgi:feruloyl esterase